MLSNVFCSSFKIGQGLGVNSTPTFAINGKKIESPKSVDEFKNLIDEAIKNSSQNQ